MRTVLDAAYPSKLFHQRQLIAAVQKLVILVKASFYNAHLGWIILSDCIHNKDYFQSSAFLNVKNYTCPFLFQQDLTSFTSSAGPPKVVAYRLNP